MRNRDICIAAVCLCACSADAVEVSIVLRPEMQMQGRQLQGIQLQGNQAQGMTLQGFQLSSATLDGKSLSNVRVDKGEVVAELHHMTLHGTDMVGAHLLAQVHNISVNPPTTATTEFQITAVSTEDAINDPTNTGATFLYSLSQNVDNTGNWQPACPTDTDGRSVAIPVTDIWTEQGSRVASTTLFTFGCTTGVIAKCYRWGYRPWLTGYGDVVSLHQSCTRLARADYCGNGLSHTRDGTVIYEWDNGPAPGPIEPEGPIPTGMLFEAGWNTSGAVCLSHARWVTGGSVIAQACPTRLIAPGVGVLNATVCDTTADVLSQSADAHVFNASNLNLNLDLF